VAGASLNRLGIKVKWESSVNERPPFATVSDVSDRSLRKSRQPAMAFIAGWIKIHAGKRRPKAPSLLWDQGLSRP
jgi:hypothetical protein